MSLKRYLKLSNEYISYIHAYISSIDRSILQSYAETIYLCILHLQSLHLCGPVWDELTAVELAVAAVDDAVLVLAFVGRATVLLRWLETIHQIIQQRSAVAFDSHH